ncbi:hypothetical protein LCGC14_1552140 [marine sediment metagenome]|uniref:Uncharacterized protein n=1 Tax=marine sediment metagenome TaxID=412755 RepID=A0A0F9IPX2_9ZZZZ
MDVFALFLFWLLPGMIGTVLLNWLFNHIDKNKIKQITISDALSIAGMTILGTAFGWLTIVVFVAMSYDELKLGKIVLWKKKKKKKESRVDKISDADILEDLFKRAVEKPSLKQQLIDKLNFEKPIKGLEELK